MDEAACEMAELRARVRSLEERVQGLRASRRVLMNLLTAQERQKRAAISRLEQEKLRLQRLSRRFASMVASARGLTVVSNE